MITLLTCCALLAFAVWLYLLFGHDGFWRTGPYLNAAAGFAGTDRDQAVSQPVVAVIPARDEAEVIATALRSLLCQDYPGQLDIIVVDDGSSDGTGEIVEALMLGADENPAHRELPGGEPANGQRRRLHLVRNSARPQGWSGKLWAVRTGIDHAEASGHAAPMLLLTDADIAHDSSTLSSLMEKMVNDRRDLVSLMVKLRVDTLWERLLIPPFVFFFQMLYPFLAVNDPKRPVAAAAGGCVLVRWEALEDAGGIQAIKGDLIDDVALGKAIKQRPGGRKRIWLGLPHRTRSLRANDTLSSIWMMVARTADTQLGHSLANVLGAAIAMTLVYLLPPLLVIGWPIHESKGLLLLGAAAWFAMSIAFWPTTKLYEQQGLWTLSLPIAALLYTAMTIDSAIQHRRGRGGLWKGRVFID
ncbi:MAG: glycosyltransferase [Geminicoccaceae bacterium]